jgi:hypothetical protein
VGEQFEDIELDFLESYTTFLSSTLASPFILRSIVSEENITSFFSLLGYLELLDGREEKHIAEISNAVILIVESLISNKELLLNFSMKIVKEVLPLLFKELNR